MNLLGYIREEMETTLVYEAETDIWKGYSCYPPHITKVLKILGLDNVEAEYEDGRESPLSIKFEMRTNQVSFRKGEKKEMSEDQKEAQRSRMIKMHEANKIKRESQNR